MLMIPCEAAYPKMLHAIRTALQPNPKMLHAHHAPHPARRLCPPLAAEAVQLALAAGRMPSATATPGRIGQTGVNSTAR